MNDNTGHGHVWKRPDGLIAKCGGPKLCVECGGSGTVTVYVPPAGERKDPCPYCAGIRQVLA